MPQTPELVRVFKGHVGGVNALRFHPAMHQLISCGADGNVFVWHFKQSLRPFRFSGHTAAVNDLAVSNDGTFFASASADKTVHLWNNNSKGVPSQVVKAHTNNVRAVDFSADNTLMLTASDDKVVKLWSLGSKARFVGSFGGHTDWVRTVRFCGDDANLIVSGGDDKSVRVWDVRVNSQHSCIVKLQEHLDRVNRALFHPDGSCVASASSDHSVKIWDLRCQKLIQHYDAHSASVNDIIWIDFEALKGTYRKKNSQSGVIDSSTTNLDASVINADADKPSADKGSSDHLNLETLGQNGPIAGLGGGSGNKGINGITDLSGNNTSAAMRCNGSGSYLVSCGSDQNVKMWDVQEGRYTMGGHEDAVKSLCFSPIGGFLASGGDDTKAFVWDSGLLKIVNSEGQPASVMNTSAIMNPPVSKTAFKSAPTAAMKAEQQRLRAAALAQKKAASTATKAVAAKRNRSGESRERIRSGDALGMSIKGDSGDVGAANLVQHVNPLSANPMIPHRSLESERALGTGKSPRGASGGSRSLSREESKNNASALLNESVEQLLSNPNDNILDPLAASKTHHYGVPKGIGRLDNAGNSASGGGPAIVVKNNARANPNTSTLSNKSSPRKRSNKSSPRRSRANSQENHAAVLVEDLAGLRAIQATRPAGVGNQSMTVNDSVLSGTGCNISGDGSVNVSGILSARGPAPANIKPTAPTKTTSASQAAGLSLIRPAPSAPADNTNKEIKDVLLHMSGQLDMLMSTVKVLDQRVSATEEAVLAWNGKLAAS